MLLPHPLNLLSTLLFKTIKDMHKQVSKDIQHLVIMLTNGHFQIHSCKLTQMPSGIGVLRTEHRTNLKDAFKSSTSRSHLLMQLGTHTQTSRFAKVIKREDIGTTLACTRQQLWSVNLDEILSEEIFPEQCAYHGLDTENGLVGRRTKVDPTMVKTSLLPDPSSLRGVVGIVIVRSDVSLSDKVGSARILHLKGHGRRGLVDTMELVHLDLHCGLCGSLHGLLRHGHCSVGIDNGFNWHARHIFDHGRRNLRFAVPAFGFKCHALHGVQ
mmetsp:Transcript_31532/g.66320  ORF Transcript_31532/g.66320 Transcript_31532/m.66320 type:complete len:269 (+) Transcript_31532:1297-2103(+)